MIFTYVGAKSQGGLLTEQLKVDNENGTYHEDILWLLEVLILLGMSQQEYHH